MRGDFEPHTMEQGPGAWEAARGGGPAPSQPALLPSPHLGLGGGGGTAGTRPNDLRAADSEPLCQPRRLAASRDRSRSLPPGSAKAHWAPGWVRPPDSRWGAPLSTPLRLGFGRPNPAPPVWAGGSGRLGPHTRKLGSGTPALQDLPLELPVRSAGPVLSTPTCWCSAAPPFPLCPWRVWKGGFGAGGGSGGGPGGGAVSAAGPSSAPPVSLCLSSSLLLLRAEPGMGGPAPGRPGTMM